jgi:hypothetical protein
MLMQVTDTAPITEVIPASKAISYKGKLLVAVKHALDEVCVLRNLGINAPSPMLYDGFKFSGRWTPMSHQVETAEFLTLNRRAFVLSEMGTGKTSAACWCMDYLRQRGYIGRILVVCPVSVTKVWMDEVFTTTPHLSVGIMTGTRSKRLNVLANNDPVVVINFDGLTSLAKDHSGRSQHLPQRPDQPLQSIEVTDQSRDALVDDDGYPSAELAYRCVGHGSSGVTTECAGVVQTV